MYSDSAVADIVCPFEISSGRLGEPVEISWSITDSGGNPVGPVTSGAYWLEEEGNRTLHVNISTLGSPRLGYKCAGQVEICTRRTSCMQSPQTQSPTFMVIPMLGKLCMNLYTCVQIFSR